MQILAWLGWGSALHPHDLPMGIRFHLLVAYLSVQGFFVVFFQSGFSNVVGTLVLDSIDLMNFLIIDWADVA